MTQKFRSRRDFMSLTGLGAAGLMGSGLSKAMAQTGPGEADLIVYNAKVYTVDDRRPKARAFAVKGDKFMAVGDDADIRRLAGSQTKLVDAQNMTVVPGFIDCHNHAAGEMVLFDVLVGNPYEVEFVTIDSVIAKLRERAKITPPGTWVEGQFFDDTKVKDGRPLTMHDLDKVSTDLPVVVTHRGGHTSYFNSKAFALAGVTKDTPAPAGGTFDKDADGELNGRVTDRAREVFLRVGKRYAYTPEQRAQRIRDGVAYISKQFVRYGLTGAHHDGFDQPEDLWALQQVRTDGQLLHRVSYEPYDAMIEIMVRGDIQSGFGDEWIRLGATAEHVVDGSFSERTMAISTPYPGINPPYQGNLTETQQDLNAWVERIHRAGIQVNCHANGDVAIDHVLTALERAQTLFPRGDTRPKITHCTLINDDLVRRIKAIGAVPAVFSTYSYYNADKFHFYGEALMERAMAFRTFLDAGVPVAAGSDFQPGPFAPLMAIQAMVTRKGWNGEAWGANQRITVDEALRVNTLNGAHASFEDRIKGSITPGKLADYVMLADDPHSVDPDTIKDIKIVRTVTGGATVYDS
jgi:predicted amidohydrolase YtcJ